MDKLWITYFWLDFDIGLRIGFLNQTNLTKGSAMFDQEKEFNRLIKLGYSATSAIAMIENADYCKKREEELKGAKK